MSKRSFARSAATNGAGLFFSRHGHLNFQNRSGGIAGVGANRKTYCASKRPNWPTPWLKVLMRLESEKTLDRTTTDYVALTFVAFTQSRARPGCASRTFVRIAIELADDSG